MTGIIGKKMGMTQLFDDDGNVVAVRRGEILLMVFYRPGENVTGQVAFTGGYPFAGGSTVSIDISGTRLPMWSESPVGSKPM